MTEEELSVNFILSQYHCIKKNEIKSEILNCLNNALYVSEMLNIARLPDTWCAHISGTPNWGYHTYQLPSIGSQMKCKRTKSFQPLRHLLQDFLQEMKKIVDMINYEIEYVLRPHTAPARFSIPILVITIHYHGHEHHHNCRHHIFELWTKGKTHCHHFFELLKAKHCSPTPAREKSKIPGKGERFLWKKKDIDKNSRV